MSKRPLFSATLGLIGLAFALPAGTAAAQEPTTQLLGVDPLPFLPGQVPTHAGLNQALHQKADMSTFLGPSWQSQSPSQWQIQSSLLPATATSVNLGVPNGAAQLDSAGTLSANSVTYNGTTISLGTIGSLAEGALSAARLGVPSGAAKLDGNGSLSTNIAGPAGAAVLQSLASRFAETIDAVDSGMRCNGSTDDTVAFNTAVTLWEAVGGTLTLPRGACVLNTAANPILANIPVSISGSVVGQGNDGTRLVDQSAGDFLVFTDSSGANLTVQNLSITRKGGTLPSGTQFSGRALAIIPGSAPGSADIDHVNVSGYSIPNTPNETDGWQAGVMIGALGEVTISHVRVLNADWSYNAGSPSSYNNNSYPSGLSALPQPTFSSTNNTATPASMAIGVADDFEVNGGSALTADIKISDVEAVNGFACYDFANVQGIYASNTVGNYCMIGVRSEDTTGLDEVEVFANGQWSVTTAGFYIGNLPGLTISNQQIVRTTTSVIPATPFFVGMWLRDTGAAAVTGSTVQGIGSRAATNTEYGFIRTNDSLYGAYPKGLQARFDSDEADLINGYGFGTSAGASAAFVADAAVNMTNYAQSFTDGGASTSNYNVGADASSGNTWQYPDEFDDGSQNRVFPKSVSIGTNANTGLLNVGASGVTQFAVNGGTGLVTMGTGSHTTTMGTSGAYSGSASTKFAFGPFPGFTAGNTALSGELTCSFPNDTSLASWRVLGHYVINNGAMTPSGFTVVVEGDSDTQATGNPITSGMTLALDPTTVSLDATESSSLSGVVCTFDGKATHTQ